METIDILIKGEVRTGVPLFLYGIYLVLTEILLVTLIRPLEERTVLTFLVADLTIDFEILLGSRLMNSPPLIQG